MVVLSVTVTCDINSVLKGSFIIKKYVQQIYNPNITQYSLINFRLAIVSSVFYELALDWAHYCTHNQEQIV